MRIKTGTYYYVADNKNDSYSRKTKSLKKARSKRNEIAAVVQVKNKKAKVIN